MQSQMPQDGAPPKEVRITARPNPDGLRCDFEVDRPIVEGVAWFGGAEGAADSPLIAALFQLEGVERVLVKGSIITVTKGSEQPWNVLAREIGARIRSAIQGGGPLLAEGAGTSTGTSDEALRDRVEEIVKTQINPALASHGGFISVESVEGGVVAIKMGGGCQGCSSSLATMKSGVETAIRAEIPEIVDVVDATDHSAGVNPYFS